MKKLFSKISALALLALPVATSCELDQVSPVNPGPEAVVNTMDDAESWRLGMYTALRTASSFEESDLQTDNFVLTNQDGNQHGMTYSWTFGNTNVDAQTTVYVNLYAMVRYANHVMAYVPQVLANGTGLTAADTLEVDQILGEAYWLRAYSYSRLAAYFCDRYDPATAGQTLGMVIENEPVMEGSDVNEQPSRVSLDSTYRFIKSDLAKARSLMNGSNPADFMDATVAAYMMPEEALDLLEARVALATCDYQRAVELCQGIIASGKYPLITTTEGLQDMWLNDRGSEVIFQLYCTKDEPGPSFGSFTAPDPSLTSQLGVTAYVPQIQPSMEALGRFEQTDIRFAATFFQGWSYAAYNANGYDANSAFSILLGKYPGNPVLKTYTTDVYNMRKLFRAPEAYLIAAEAEYRQGHTGEALSYYNALHHTARGASELTTTDNFLNDLCDEYTREYIGEGLLFGVLKRLNMGMSRGGNQQVGTQTNGTVISIEPDNMRWTWNIPQQDLNANPNLEGNW